MLKKLCLSAMVGLSVMVGSMTAASAADVWVYTGRPMHRECTSTDYYIVTETITGNRYSFSVEVKVVNQPMGGLEATYTYKFAEGARCTFQGPKGTRGDIRDNELAYSIYQACQEYR
jgi:hypothetical protein